MEPRLIGIYLMDAGLARQLAGYWRKKAPQYRFNVYEESSAVRLALAETAMYRFLTDKEGGDRLGQKAGEGWYAGKVGKVLYLSEEKGGADTVCRYQSADRILAELLGMESERAQEKERPEYLPAPAEKSGGHKTEVIGVYSPVGRCGKSRFALTLGRVLGEREKVLYLSLEAFSDLYRWLTDSGGGDFSDLLYYLSQGRLSGSVLKRIARSYQGVSMIGPAVNPEDILGLNVSDCRAVLECAAEAGYRSVILDIGAAYPDPAGLLALCSRIFAPVTEEETARLKWIHFSTYMEKTHKKEILDRIVTVRLPDGGNGYEADGFPECGEELESFARGLSCWEN
jgi:hypothetical protein